MMDRCLMEKKITRLGRNLEYVLTVHVHGHRALEAADPLMESESFLI